MNSMNFELRRNEVNPDLPGSLVTIVILNLSSNLLSHLLPIGFKALIFKTFDEVHYSKIELPLPSLLITFFPSKHPN